MRQKNLEHVCEVGTMEPERDAVPAKQNGLEPKRDKLQILCEEILHLRRLHRQLSWQHQD